MSAIFASVLLLATPRRRRQRGEADVRRAAIAAKFDRLWQLYPLGAELVENVIDDLIADEEVRANPT